MRKRIEEVVGRIHQDVAVLTEHIEYLEKVVDGYRMNETIVLEQTERIRAISDRAGMVPGDSIADGIADYVERLEKELGK